MAITCPRLATRNIPSVDAFDHRYSYGGDLHQLVPKGFVTLFHHRLGYLTYFLGEYS